MKPFCRIRHSTDLLFPDTYLAQPIVLALCLRVELCGAVRVEFVIAKIIVQSVEFRVRGSDVRVY